MSKKIWSEAENEYLKNNYPHISTAEIAKYLNRSLCSCYTHAEVLGLKKTQEFLKSDLGGRFTKMRAMGYNFRFKKGITPHNKGKKQTDYMKPEAIEKTKKTRFKKGNIPPNTKFDNAISLRECDGYKVPFIRISKAKWIPLKIKILIDNFGEIPKGHVIRVKDLNQFNLVPENLECISMKENMSKNSIVNYPTELIRTIKLKNDLLKTIKNLEK